MRNRYVLVIGAFAIAIAVALVPAHLAGQAPVGAAKTSKAYTPPHTPDGHPDLQGVYNTATLTPLERNNDKHVLTDEEAVAIEKAEATRRERAARPSRGDRTAPPKGGDGSTGAAGLVGGYNNFWIDRGDSTIMINGERRAALLIDPPDGRVPPVTADARARNGSRAAQLRPTSDTSENSNNPNSEGPGAYDDMERRPLGERCLIGFGSTSGPPMLPVLYNNFKEIVQTKDHVMILVEMDHDARIIRLNQPHAPKSVRKWLGDSIGHYEGDTLVVDTTNFTDKTRYRGATENLHVIERFSRLDDKTLLYRFTIDDPGTWTKPWTAEYPWPLAAPDEHLYEYACHEGNYALGDILRGARILENEAEAAKKGQKK